MWRKLKQIISGWLIYMRVRTASHEQVIMAMERLTICENCPKNRNGFCGICGCYLPAKIMVVDSDCPESRWLPVIPHRRRVLVPMDTARQHKHYDQIKDYIEVNDDGQTGISLTRYRELNDEQARDSSTE